MLVSSLTIRIRGGPVRIVSKLSMVLLIATGLTSSAILSAESQDSLCPECGKSLSNAFVQVAKNGRPSVVHIRGEMGGQSAGNYQEYAAPSNPFEQFQDELFQRFFGAPGADKRSGPRPPQGQSHGSGFIVSSDGYIVTNHHVVKDATRIVVEKYDEVEKEFEAVLVGCDPKTDLAVLKIEATDLPFATFGDSDNLEAGQWTIAIGHPFKLRDTVTAGVISAMHRGDLKISQLEDFIQTDTAINPGSSGGPLFNLDGKVIGVNTAILSRSGGNIGVGFAVPSNVAKMVFEQIKDKGAVDRGFLGVQIQDLSEDLVAGFKLKKGTTGALIAEVVPGSCAEIAGLEAGDVVIEFNGADIKGAKQLYNSIGRIAAGDQCKMKVLRNGKAKMIAIVLGSKSIEIVQEGDVVHRLGVIIEQLTPETAHKYNAKTDEKGVVITRVIPGSVAAMMGWSEGAIILVVNGENVQSVGDVKRIIEKSSVKDRIVFLMHYNGRASFHSVPHPNVK